MSVATFPSEDQADRLGSIRVRGGVRLAFAVRGGKTFASRVAESDGYRVRFPIDNTRCEAVTLNTGGGIAGGDRVHIEAELAEAAEATITSVAAERIYRSLGPASRIDVRLNVGADAALAWLPQETILYSGSRLERRVDVDLAPRARLTFLDIVVAGRRGSGERMSNGLLADQWRVRRAGKLIHAEALRIDGSIETTLARPGVAGGAHVVGTLLHVAPDAENHLEAVRQRLPCDDGLRVAASVWKGRMVVRAIGARTDHVRNALAAAAESIMDAPLPRSWRT